MARAGAVWVDVLPNMSRFSRELDRQISEPIVTASRRAGEDGGEAASGGLRNKIKVGALAAGVAAGAALTAGLAQAMEGEKATAKLKAQLNLMGPEAKKAGRVAGDLYASAVTDSVEEGAEAVKAVMGAGLVDSKASTGEIKKISAAASDMATLFGQDVTTAAKAAGSMLRNGLAKDGMAAMDLLTGGFQRLGPKAEDLGETFDEYSPFFKQLGLDAKTALGLMNQGLKNGAWNTDKIADAMKEFSLRATSGDKPVQDMLKQLGVNATKTEEAIARGGPAARKAFDTVLDALRETDDAALRAQAVQTLFGGPGEDLGASLFSLNVDTATKGLGKLSGAAKQAGDDMRDNTATQVEQFKRGAMQGLANVLANEVIPAIRDVAPVVRSALAPVGALWKWLTAEPGRLRAAAVALLAIGGAIATFKVVSGAVAGVRALSGGIASAGRFAVAAGRNIRFAAFAARYYTVIGAQSAKQAVRTGASWAASAARSGAGWASSAGRATVSFARTTASAVANATRTAATWTASAVRSGMGWAAARARAVGSFAATAASATVNAGRTAAVWVAAQVRAAVATTRATLALARQRLVMVGTTIATRAMAAGQWLLNAAMRANPVGLIITGLMLLGGALILAYKKSSTFRAIVQAAMRGVMTAIRAVGRWGTWLWKNALQPAFRGIGAVVSWWWKNIVQRYFALVRGAFRTVGAIGKWLWKNAIQPAFRGIGAIIRGAYSGVIKPVLDKGRAAIRAFGRSFETAKEAAGKAFAKLRGITKKPVQFIVDIVYNNGIRAVWNKVAGLVGLGKLKAVKFADGGRTQGGVPGKDSIPALMMADEYVVKRSSARSVGFGTLDYINRTGQLPPQQPVQRFADGGWVGSVGGALKGGAQWVGKGASKIKDFAVDAVDILSDPAKIWGKLTAPIRKKIQSLTQNPWARAAAKVPAKVISSLKDKVVSAAKSAVDFGGGDVGGSGVKRWSKLVLTALKMVGQPASLLPVVLRRMNQESGGNPKAINNWDINAKNGTPSKGLMQVIDPTFNAYAGKLRKRGVWDPLANIYASMRYALARYGSLAKAYNRAGGYASGGRPRAGELAWVGERGPELVRFRGGEEVYDHRTSMGMAAGVGARGFASGTSRARGQLPGDLKAWTKALSGSASQIKSAAKELSKDLRAAGGAGKRLAKSTDSTSKKLQSLAGKRDALQKKIEQANSYIGEQKTAARDFIAISQLGEATTIADVISGVKEKQATAKAFQDSIGALKKRGLNKTFLEQLIGMGPESGLAGVLAGANKGQIAQLNQLAKSGAKLASSYGRTMGDYLYDAGARAGKGILSGLKAQEKQLQAQMNKLGAGMVKSIKRALRIKSPSRVMRDEVGVQVGAGLAAGMASAVPSVVAQADRLQAAAVPAGAVVPVGAAVAAGQQPAQAGLQPGQPVRLIVGDREMNAYVDDRIDTGLTQVRRRSRAGVK